MNDSSSPLRLELRDVRKRHGRNEVLRGVTWSVRRGEVHVLAGVNGAGKSTLLGILSGASLHEAGDVVLDGRPVRFSDPRAARRAGVAMIHQELSLVPSMSIVDNVFLGREAGSRRARRDRARRALAELGVDVDVERAVETLPVSQRQLVEIAKALGDDDRLRVLLLDEPTSALGEAEVNHLFDRIRALAARGCGIVFVTHRMEEVHAIGDRITILRDGRVARTDDASRFTRGAIVEEMLGRAVTAPTSPSKRAPSPSAPRLLVDRLVADGVREASFDVAPGETVALVGLTGAGCSELLHAVFGARPRRSGRVLVDGEPAATSARASIDAGVALLDADRKSAGLLFGFRVVDNVALASLDRFSRLGVVRDRAVRGAVEGVVRETSFIGDIDGEVDRLSGGNQQKIYLARALLVRPRLLLLDEPTRGVDVGAKADLHALLRALADAGTSIVFASSELEEVTTLADRIVAMHRGRVVCVLARGATREEILAAAMGVDRATTLRAAQS